MAISTPEENCEGLTDCEPLLMVMEHTETCAREDYVINVSGDVMASSSGFGGGCPPNTHVSLIEDGASNGTHVPNSQESSSSSGSSDSNNSTLIRRDDGYGHRNRSPLNSGPWISVELFVTLSQIIAAIIVLLLSRDEKTQSPLFVWIVGYTAGCIATLPLLYWRNLHRNDQENVQESMRNQGSSHNVSASENNSYTVISIPEMLEEQQHRTSTSLTEESRLRFNALVDHFKMALDCFFAVWFVVGNVWIFGGHSSSSDAPNLYRLCIVFLTFSCIGYAMPFILCATICCCLPCLMSLLGYGEDMNQTRGATPEVINALPTYRFQAKKNGTICESEINLDGEQQGGILGHGTEKERLISADDAVCCICLAAYIDNDELRELPCAHCFHMDCVDKWLKINATCPLCKYEVETAIPGVASDQNQDENRVRNTSVLESTELR